ncbi:alpha/beta hydrolase fold domain-containing protein [Trichoderma evansii]
MEHFSFDQDWKNFAEKNSLPIPSNAIPEPGPIEALDIDFSQARPYQAEADKSWAASHPFSSVGYVSQLKTFVISDGVKLSVKISCPGIGRLKEKGIPDPYKLPVLFVTHGGGWVSGSHVSEEAWLLWPLYRDLDFITISVEYRLAPEHKFPTWIEDSWEILCQLVTDSSPFTSDMGVSCDISKLILIGSSSGATITATLAQRCRDTSKSVLGVVLNVPVLCHYLHFPSETGISGSYYQCTETYLGSREMATCWDMVISPTLGADPQVSPLLGAIKGLTPHFIFVAGRDCLRDEGILYAKRLEDNGVAVKLHVYAGVPHNFAHYEELSATARFWQDLKQGLQQWLAA